MPAMAVRARPQSPPTWQKLSECPRCIIYRPHLRRTILTALTVGTILFIINQLNVVVAGHATPVVWAKAGVTYLVPFCVANIGLLVGCRRRPPGPALPGEADCSRRTDAGITPRGGVAGSTRPLPRSSSRPP